MLPAHEHNTSGAVHGNLLVFVGVEFDPVHWARLRKGGLDDHADDGASLVHVSPVPKGDRLQVGLGTNRHDVLIVRAQVHADDSVRVRVIVSSDGDAVFGVPHNEHTVLASVCSHEPLLVI